MSEAEEVKRENWTAYITVGVFWFFLEIANQSRIRLDEPFNWRTIVFSTVIAVCIMSGVSDLWQRFVRPNLIGLALISILLFGVKLWLITRPI